jgi:dienelactone hydrolase
MKTPTLQLSPSILHNRLTAEAPRALAFSDGPIAPWRTRLRRKVIELLGLNRMPQQRPGLNVRTLWQQDHPLGCIEKIAFTSEPGSDALAYVCLPRNAAPPYTFMICLQGHTSGMHHSIAVERDDETKPMVVEGDREFALGCMARGIAALCIEQRSFGLRREQHQAMVSSHGCHDAAMHALMLGRTLAGERVYDVDRGIDYLAQRSDVDMDRIGVMGNSGGGKITIYAAAVLPRIRFAMPSCSFCTYEHSLMQIYHCSDNYVPRILEYAEMADVLGLFAPRPVVVVAGKQDMIFPISAVRTAFRDLQRIYQAAGAADQCRLVVGPEGHRFYAQQGWGKLLPLIGQPSPATRRRV